MGSKLTILWTQTVKAKQSKSLAGRDACIFTCKRYQSLSCSWASENAVSVSEELPTNTSPPPPPEQTRDMLSRFTPARACMFFFLSSGKSASWLPSVWKTRRWRTLRWKGGEHAPICAQQYVGKSQSCMVTKGRGRSVQRDLRAEIPVDVVQRLVIRPPHLRCVRN